MINANKMIKAFVIAGLLMAGVFWLAEARAASDRDNLLAVAIMNGIDFMQSSKMFHTETSVEEIEVCDRTGYCYSTWLVDPPPKEYNPLLNEKPTDAELITYFVGSTCAFWAAQQLVPDGILKNLFSNSVLETIRTNLYSNKNVIENSSEEHFLPGFIIAYRGEW